jgi:hypothetical protein
VSSLTDLLSELDEFLRSGEPAASALRGFLARRLHRLAGYAGTGGNDVPPGSPDDHL